MEQKVLLEGMQHIHLGTQAVDCNLVSACLQSGVTQ